MQAATSLAIAFSVLLINAAFAVEKNDILPLPHYHAEDSDPDWLRLGTQMHGHLGPWMTAGMRIGAAGRKAVGAEGYFDVQVTCRGPFDGPPRSCFIDGLQLSTGATLGKRNLQCVEAKNIEVLVENTKTHQKVLLKPTTVLLEKFDALAKQASEMEHAHDQMAVVERMAREVAAMKDSELFTVQPETSPAG